MTATETWLPVPGWEGYYEVSDQGRIRSLDRTITEKTGMKKRLKGKILSPGSHSSGHLHVNLMRDGKQHTRRLHALVAEAFIGPRPAGLVCCHNDGNPLNNTPGNLRYDTQKGNLDDMKEHGTHHNTNKEMCPRGHPLASPNLATYESERGQRRCLACSRGAAKVNRTPSLKGHLQEVSDSYYQALLPHTRKAPTP